MQNYDWPEFTTNSATGQIYMLNHPDGIIPVPAAVEKYFAMFTKDSEGTRPIEQNQQQQQQQQLAPMYKWSVAEVIKFIESHEEIKEFAHRFAEHHVDGEALTILLRRSRIEMLEQLSAILDNKRGAAMKVERILSEYRKKPRITASL